MAKNDKLVALFKDYVEKDFTPEEMADHMRLEFKRDPRIMSSVADEPVRRKRKKTETATAEQKTSE